jgi:hypothetical protein
LLNQTKIKTNKKIKKKVVKKKKIKKKYPKMKFRFHKINKQEITGKIQLKSQLMKNRIIQNKNKNKIKIKMII